MKKILFFLIFLPVLAFAQESIISDTSYIENRAGTFWQVRTQTFSGGAIVTRQDPIGTDTSAVVQAVIGPFFTQFSQYAGQAATVQVQYARQRQGLGSANSILINLLGRNYITVVSDELRQSFIGTYTMRVNGGAPVQAEIIRLASGVIRYRQDGQNFVFDIFAPNWIRIRNYDGNAFLDLFLDQGSGTYIDLSTGLGIIKYRLKKQ